MSTDQIRKKILLKAPRSKVWKAITDAEQFGAWFQVRLEGQFAPGAKMKGRILTPGYDHLTFELVVVEMKPEVLFSYRWHPYAIDPQKDYSQEPMTLVEFHLQDAKLGTELNLLESGFDQIPAERRAEAYRMNDGGWQEQMLNLERYVSA